MLVNTNLLKLFYNVLLTGLPSISSNPINKNTLVAPFVVDSGSTYINYKLDKNQYEKLSDHLLKTTNNLKLRPIYIFKSNKKSDMDILKKEYYLSINIYNCTSPIFNFLSKDPITRCEINTYVINEKGEIGTLIMDYTSNILSILDKPLSANSISLLQIHSECPAPFNTAAACLLTIELPATVNTGTPIHSASAVVVHPVYGNVSNATSIVL